MFFSCSCNTITTFTPTILLIYPGLYFWLPYAILIFFLDFYSNVQLFPPFKINFILYDLQLTYNVRLIDEDKKRKNIKATQIGQNKVLRLLDGSRLKAGRNIQDMLEKCDLLSIIQTLLQNKLKETWKAIRDPDFQTKMQKWEWRRKMDSGEP